MKTKFYKRLVPIALIASMAVTNVGMTSASAQEVTAGFTQTVDAQDVGGTSTIAVGDVTKYALKAAVTKDAEYKKTGSTVTDNTNFELEVSLKDDAPMTGVEAGWFSVVANKTYSEDDVSDSSDIIAQGKSIDGTKVKFDIPASAFGSSRKANDTLTLKLAVKYVFKGTEGTSVTSNDTLITLTYKEKDGSSSSGGTTTQQSAPAGNSFQIPGGLTSKGTTVNAYTVGVAKVTADETDLSNNNVKNTAFTADNTVGEWKDAYVGETDASHTTLNLTPAVNNVPNNSYVLYYVPNGSSNPMFIRLLSTDEVGSLPKGDKLTDATLTKYTDKTKAEDAAKTDQYKIEHSTITGVSTSDYAAYKTMKQLFDIVFTGTRNSAFGYKEGYEAKNKASDSSDVAFVGDIDIPENDTIGLVKVPKINSVDAGDILINDKVFVDELIKVYDNGKTGDNVFAKKKTVTGEGTENEKTEMWLKVEDNGSYTISNDGVSALYDILSASDFSNAKKYMTAKGVGEKTSGLYNEIYARAKALYINAYNTKLASSEADLSLLNWVMETLPGDSAPDPKNSDKTVFSKANSSAAFWGRAKATATADSAIKTAKGASVKVTNTKAANKFNAAVYLKGVSKDYVPAKSATVGRKGTVYFTQGFFVPPAAPTAFTAKSLKPPTAKDGMTLATATGYADTASATRVFNLTLDVGKSMALPFKLADGQEKDLVYEISEGSAGFTVINGKVTATNANDKTFENVSDGVTVADANVIKVYSRVNPDVYALVQVKTNAAVNSVRANASALAIWPGSVQTVSLGTVPATKNGTYKYKITYTSDAIEVYKGDSESTTKVTSGTCIEDTNLITVKAVGGKTVAKGATIKVEVCNAEGAVVQNKGKAVKPLEIKLSAATAPQDVKSIKTAVKSKETDADGHKVINIPVGGAYNVGFTVAPTAADPTIDANSYNNNTAVATVSGDVITGVDVGSTQVTFELPDNTNRADGFKSADAPNGTVTYEVKVYKPGASIKLADSSYTIKGGFLMTKEESDTTCNKVFTAGKTYSMTKPVTSPAEDIIWKANNPAAIKFVENDANLEFTPCQTGTFTVTGLTKYTNQKLVFKVEVGANNADADVAAAKDDNTENGEFAVSLLKKNGEAFTLGTGDDLTGQSEFKVGESLNAFYSSGVEGVGGSVTFALKNAEDKSKLVVSKTGMLTAKSAGKVTVVATMMKDKTTELCKKEFTVTVEPKTITKKSSSGDTSTIAGDAKGAKMSIALNNYDKKTMTLAWYYVKKNESTKNLIADNQDKLSGPVIFGDSATGDYNVYVQALNKTDEVKAADLDDATKTIGDVQLVGTVRVYPKDQGIKVANLDMGDKDSKKAVSALGVKYDSSKPATAINGTGNNHTYYIPVFVTAAGENFAAATDSNDVSFTISNKSLVESCIFMKKSDVTASDLTTSKDQENDIVKNWNDPSVYGFIKVVTPNNKYSGMVTIKATLRNSNKAVTLKLNLRGEEKAPNFAYDPQNLANAFTDTKVNLYDVSGADAKKKLYGSTDFQTEADKNKAFSAYKYVLVNTTDTKSIKAANWGEKVYELEEAEIGAANASTKKSAVKLTKGTGLSDLTSGTWYLALADKSYTIKTKKDDKNEHAEVEENATKNKIVKICSHTPIMGSAASSGTTTTTAPTGGGSETTTTTVSSS